MTLDIRVQPRASRDRVAGVQGDAVKIQITAAPTDGEANEALVRFLAKTLGCPRSSVEILRGKSSRRKLVLFRGTTLVEARRALMIEAEATHQG